MKQVLGALLSKEQHQPVLTTFPFIVPMERLEGVFGIWLSLTSGSISNMRIINFHELFDKNEFNTLKLMAMIWISGLAPLI